LPGGNTSFHRRKDDGGGLTVNGSMISTSS
jgi:hypothetical protein